MHSNILCAMWNEIDFDCNAKIMLRIANSIVYMPDFAVSSDHCPCSTTAELKRFPLVFAQVHLHQTQIISLKSCWFWTFQRQFILSRHGTQFCMARLWRTKLSLGKLMNQPMQLFDWRKWQTQYGTREASQHYFLFISLIFDNIEHFRSVLD